MKRLALILLVFAMWPVAILSVPDSWAHAALLAGGVVLSYLGCPRPQRPQGDSRWLALERLFWVTGHDRIRTRDPRILWRNC